MITTAARRARALAAAAALPYLLTADILWYRNPGSDRIHHPDCKRRGVCVRWAYADGMTAEQVTEIIADHPWLRWCGLCRPRPRRRVGPPVGGKEERTPPTAGMHNRDARTPVPDTAVRR